MPFLKVLTTMIKIATSSKFTGIRLSKVKKLDGIRSWSLEAGPTCPGSYDKNGNVIDVCEGCYAKGGNYKRFPHVNESRRHNRHDWKRDEWVSDMIAELDNDRYFRWFDSGDIYHKGLANKILLVCSQTQWVKHWIPTRSYKIKSIHRILVKINALPNVVVRYSSDSIVGDYGRIHGSTIIPNKTADDSQLSICKSYETGRCNGCRNCWDKKVCVVAYPAHGKKMLKLIGRHTGD